MAYTTKTKKSDILQDLLTGSSPSILLASYTDPVLRGYIGETVLDCLVSCGIHPTDVHDTVEPLDVNPSTRRVESRDTVQGASPSTTGLGGGAPRSAASRRIIPERPSPVGKRWPATAARSTSPPP